jgi:hypothetical protein
VSRKLQRGANEKREEGAISALATRRNTFWVDSHTGGAIAKRASCWIEKERAMDVMETGMVWRLFVALIH